MIPLIKSVSNKIPEMSARQKIALASGVTALASATYLANSYFCGSQEPNGTETPVSLCQTAVQSIANHALNIGIAGAVGLGGFLVSRYQRHVAFVEQTERDARALRTAEDKEAIRNGLCLRPSQIEQIEQYVAAHFAEWDIPEEKDDVFEKRSLTIRKNKDLPRTLRVFKEKGKTVIMVLCNEKQGAPLVGRGGTKFVKRAFRLSDKALFARCIEKDDIDPIPFNAQMEMGKCLEGKPGMPPPSIGVNTYHKTKATYEKREYFQPLRCGDLKNDYIDLSAKDCRSVAIQLLEALKTLKREGIFYKDLYLQNILYYREENGAIKIELADYSAARRELGNDAHSDTELAADVITKLRTIPSVRQDPETSLYLLNLANVLKNNPDSLITIA